MMVQSRDHRLESSGTALAEVYHHFVQIRALDFKILHEKKFKLSIEPLKMVRTLFLCKIIYLIPNLSIVVCS